MAWIARWLGAFGWRPFVDVVPGGYQVNLTAAEQRTVRDAMDDLRVMLAERDANTRRIFPTAYVHDAERDAEFHALMGDELLQGQLAALDVVERTLDGQVIDRGEAESWMRAVNGVRLALGTRLDVGEEPMGRLRPDDPDLRDKQVYELLNVVLGSLVAALSASD